MAQIGGCWQDKNDRKASEAPAGLNERWELGAGRGRAELRVLQGEVRL